MERQTAKPFGIPQSLLQPVITALVAVIHTMPNCFIDYRHLVVWNKRRGGNEGKESVGFQLVHFSSKILMSSDIILYREISERSFSFGFPQYPKNAS